MVSGSNMDQMLAHWRTNGAHWVEYAAPKLLIILVVATFLVVALRTITNKLVDFSKAHHVHTGLRAQQLRTLASVIQSVGTVLIYFLAAMQALPLFGVDVKPILASAGIAGLAIGFGAQTLVKDVINGFFILLENQYDLGDHVRVAGVSGTVEAMTLRRTTLRDPNGTVHVVPNSEIKVVSNMTRDWAQITLSVAVDYQEKSDIVIKLLEEVSQALYADANFRDLLVAQPEVPGIERVANNEVDYSVVAKVIPGEQLRVSRELRRRIKDCFIQQNVRTPAPTRIYVTDPTAVSGQRELK
ncbi:MAG TPA: mechanosensitive ion channel family protein [Terriglobales bacterium]|nr:mechanosensitive ion channel family protein [Terriglobales bacterium]